MDISPDKQNIDSVFSNTTYFIDFYQRQYKWNEEPVKRLLEDVFYRFNEEYKKFKDSDIRIDQLIDKFSWYYLNTYVTNLVEGKLFVVDGQQRLTTLTLILIKLKHLSELHKSDLIDWIKSKIMGTSGFKKEFWMNHTLHITAMQDLFDGKDPNEIDTSSGVTAKNMVKNYIEISKWLNVLDDKKEFETFVFYFLRRLVLINLDVKQTDVPMVFEVINDRGIKLKPYEILKGKLLGQIDKDELVSLDFNEIWDNQVKLINSFKEDEIDEFFIYFLKGKLSETRGLAQKFDKDYHRVMFEDEYNQTLMLKHNPKGVKTFLLNDFVYYTNIYAKVYNYYREFNDNQPYVFYNNLTDMNSQFLLIMSACVLNDPDEEQKIFSISKNLDKLFCLLQLQRGYNSNSFATGIYKLSSDIRNQSLEKIQEVFDNFLLQELSNQRQLPVENKLNYNLFRETGIDLDKRFKRYFFARIEKFISSNTKMEMKQTFYNLVQNTGAVNGFHIEHILSYNAENLLLFDNNEEVFERERNRLGGLLLLKGLDNISSNNENFKKKLKSYSNTLYWNETLRADSYKSKLDFYKMINVYKLNFKSYDQFGAEELEERHKLLFDIANIIW
ncbi:DUF262 domain-containing protein [Chryseobacterium sp. Leaf201]|uniref:DUF262 domain-containing protein n=1 Tax=Chryseobacterium sp. Leaf201 TaxID=1735672 RepID=UPI0006F9930D|nr:DUF262 domain-containing protein [Chryseobacterium sp. Leaf201]KQM45882.1 hypothetical protein ASE55_11635 [Chryseobacterium sp. Leaf201]